MTKRTLPPKTKGRTLNYAARVYDFCQERMYLSRDRMTRERLMELVDFSQFGAVLDVGCATGNLTLDIARHLSPGGNVVGIDAAPNMVAVARRKAGDLPVEFRVALAEELPFDDGTFDAVASTFFFHHLPLDLKRRAFAEAFRVLQPGGWIVTVDID